MAQLIDWSILTNNEAVTSVIPDEVQHAYDLFNLTDSNALYYGERFGDNINLTWGNPATSDNVRFWRESGTKDPVLYDEPIAINIRKGKFLVYERGRQGINLGWSNTPKFEWKILGSPAGKPAGTPVPVNAPIGLYSMVENDLLMYEPRDWGINLKWFKDSGTCRGWSPAVSLGQDAVKVGKMIYGAI